MVGETPAEPILTLVARMQARRPELHRRLQAEVESRIPDFAFTDNDAESRAEQLRDDVIDGVLNAVQSGEVGNVAFNHDLGQAMASAGLPLEHHFLAHRTAYPLLLSALLEELAGLGRGDLVPEVVVRHAAHASAVTEAYVSGYVEQRAMLEVDSQQQARVLVSALLSADLPWTPRLSNLAAGAGLDVDTSVLVLVMTWEHMPAELSIEMLRRRVSAWLTLAPSTAILSAAAGIEGIVMPDRGSRAVVDTLRRATKQLTSQGVAGARCGLSVIGPVGDARRLHRQASIAHGAATVDQPVLSLESLDPIRYLVSASDADARLVVSEGARRLHQLRDRTTPSSREILDAWQRHGAVAQVAERLHCHPNTVLNRLRTIAALTGATHDDPVISSAWSPSSRSSTAMSLQHPHPSPAAPTRRPRRTQSKAPDATWWSA